MTDDMPGSEFQVDRRLVTAGETVTFRLRDATPEDRFEIFPRYLERCDPERARKSPAPLQWLDDLDRETLPATNVITYVPRQPGNYLARWTSKRHGVEYRYFAAIDQSYVIYRPAVWCWPTPFPAAGGSEIHNGGLPLDWCLDATTADASYHSRLRGEQQRYGGGLVYGVDIPRQNASSDAAVGALQRRVADLRRCGLDVGRVGNLWYGGGLSNAKVQVARAAGFDVLDGYVPRASSCGLGAPYFPFYVSPHDYRRPSQSGPTQTIAFVFDFVGSWHFHGPIGFHRPSAEGSWQRAKFYIDLAAQEAALTARNSGSHNVITTLVNYESPVAWANADRGPRYGLVWDVERGRDCFEKYMHLLAFEHPRRWPIVFARAADYADYFRAHYPEMPRRIVSSISHDLAYDRFWTDEWHERGLSAPGYVPFAQSLRAFREARAMPQYNMPMSREFINYCDNRKTCRFEYACPKPVHYYDLTGTAPWADQPPEVNLPDPEIALSTTTRHDRYEMTFELTATAEFPDYLLAIWDVPREFRRWQVETNAKEFTWIENTDGDCRGIVRFDLKPSSRITLQWRP
jgi:hypothetical protein